MTFVLNYTRADEALTPEELAATVNASLKEMIGTKEGIINNMSNPLMTNQLMSTYSGEKFDAQIACDLNYSLFEVMATPTDSGDLENFILFQDMDVDEEYEYLHEFKDNPISGICANGIISCNEGTWNDCKSFQWVASNEGYLSLQQTALSSLGGCYCINNSCGNGLAIRNIKSIMEDLGGAIYSTIGQILPDIAISSVQVDGSHIRYIGNRQGSCLIGGEPNPALYKYFSKPEDIEVDSSSTADTHSVHQLLMSSQIAEASDYQLFSCEKNRDVQVEDVSADQVILYDGGKGSITSCGEGCLQLSLGQIGNNYYLGDGQCVLYEEMAQFWVEKPERILDAVIERAYLDDHLQLIVDDSLIWTGPTGTWLDLNNLPGYQCERSQSWVNVPVDINITNMLNSYGQHTVRFRVGVQGAGEAFMFGRIYIDESCGLAPDVTTNTCEAYESNPGCRLKEEYIDDVRTFFNYNPTGVTPLPIPKLITGPTCSFDVVRPWWKIKRVYQCENESRFDLSHATQRYATVDGSVNQTGYDDYVRNEHGSFELKTGNTLRLPDVPVLPACELTCKTRRVREAVEVAGLGPELLARNDHLSLETRYLSCTQGEIPSCPVGEGEEIIINCQCISDFAEATARMQSIRLGSMDKICTSGNLSDL